MPLRGDVSGRLNLRQRNRTSEEGRFVGHPIWVSQRAHFVLREAMEDERMSMNPRRLVIIAARSHVNASRIATDVKVRAHLERGTGGTGISNSVGPAAVSGCTRPGSI
jgi:hypothetical protein